MTRKSNFGKTPQATADEGILREILGYLNFSNGKPDPSFQRNLNQLYSSLGGEPASSAVRDLLVDQLCTLRQSGAAFQDSQQAEAIIKLTFDEILPAYWRHHADLLFSIRPQDVPQAFFTARVFEAALEQGGPWDDIERVVSGTITRLNDFVGYRPVAVLENDRRMEPYPHERFRPIPLYLEGVGVACGRYQALIERTIEFFRNTPDEVLQASYFDLDLLQELALDIRAHDHTHPVTKRTNYTFGEWDPHQIDLHGRYRRFVIRKIIVDALLDWMNSARNVDREELLYDASAVLCGTMLMASSISGSGPDTHDSSVSLTSLLPKVARQRDAFYERLLEEAQGPRAKRLLREAKLTQQPFGHVRQHLNILLAGYGARQVQHRHLAQLFARIGNSDAARDEAAIIPSSAARFETEIRWRVKSAHRDLEHGELNDGVGLLREAVDHLRRGIDCGAFVDPWNILGFQGHFPLFSCREDSIPDQRVLVLLEMMEQLFGLFSHALSEAASQSQAEMISRLSSEFHQLAEWWDRFATSAVEDLPQVSGRESWESGTRVARTLLEWRSAGEASGDISFWRSHVGEFESAKAYAQVVDALIRKQDHVAAMGLLIQWLSRAEDVGLESGPYSVHALLLRWMSLVTSGTVADQNPAATWTVIRKLFDYLEANAGSFWKVPTFEQALGGVEAFADPEMGEFDVEENEPAFEGDDLEEDEESESNLYEAAYEDVTFHDSARDGHADDTIDGADAYGNTEMEFVARSLEPRMRFFDTLARLWQTAATFLTVRLGNPSSNTDTAPFDAPRDGFGDSDAFDTLAAWQNRANEIEQDLFQLCASLARYDLAPPSGDHDSNVDFDLQQQTKLYLLHSTLTTQVRMRRAERFLRCCLPSGRAEADLDQDEVRVVRVYRGILAGDVAAVRRTLPDLVSSLARSPLLYVAFEHGGRPESMREVRMRQSVIRFLLTHLPRLGFLRETWDLLQTAYRMERESRPDGLAVTEFDQLFRTALQNTLRCVVRSSSHWTSSGKGGERSTLRRRSIRRVIRAPRRGISPSVPMRSLVFRAARGTGRSPAWPIPGRRRRSPEPEVGKQIVRPISNYSLRRETRQSMQARDQLLIDVMNEIIEHYLALWLKHSRTMRLSSIEELNQPAVWRDVRKFIERYGAELLHARMLTLGNIRSILHNGVERFLDYLEENRDPLHPMQLIDDLDEGTLDADHAATCLEIIYESLIDKFDRFVEYNTTTTQSDYGEMIHSLFDFLRAESAYERDAWNLFPVQIAHEALTESGRNEAALIWESLLASRSAELADKHLKALARLEKKYGMRLPSISDHISERFVKPMAVNRMTALVPSAMEDARQGRPSTSFALLRDEIRAYLDSTAGSSIDVPVWLRSLERAVDNSDLPSPNTENGDPSPINPPILLSWNQTRRQLRGWE